MSENRSWLRVKKYSDMPVGMKIVVFGFIGFVVLIWVLLIGIMTSGSSSGLAIPEDQRIFQEQWAEGKSRYFDAPNSIVEDEVYAQTLSRASAFAKRSGGRIENWRGVVTGVYPTLLDDGLQVVMESTVGFLTFEYKFEVKASPGDPAWEHLKQYGARESVAFSGSFEMGKDGRLRELNFSKAGAMTGPEFKLAEAVIQRL